MSQPNYLQGYCPNCGYEFTKPNPVHLKGKNNIVIGLKTNCPSCNHHVTFPDFGTDSKGNFYIKDVFNYIRHISSLEKLRNIKSNLEKLDNSASPEDLVNSISQVDANFSKFQNFIKSIPKNQVKFWLPVLLNLVIIIMAYRQSKSSDKNHKEIIEKENIKIEIKKEQLEIDKEILQINKDILEGKNSEKIELKKQIDELETNLINKLSQEDKKAKFDKRENLPKTKIIKDNKCPCGSGKKQEICHPFGLIFRLKT